MIKMIELRLGLVSIKLSMVKDSLSRDDLQHYNDVIQEFIEKSNPERIQTDAGKI